MEKTLKRLSFGLLVLTILVLVVATLVEKTSGTATAFKWIYGSWPFAILWIVMTLSATVYIFTQKLVRRPATFLLHASFVVILLGAFATFVSGQRGSIHIRTDEPASAFEGGEEVYALPFEVSLKEFEVEFYPGTGSPMDFVSRISFSDSSQDAVVSMNNIANHHGYRFYQSGYDADGLGVRLSVSHDPWGIAITYTGYILLLLSMIFFLVDPKESFRKLLKAGSMKGVSAAVLLLFLLIAPANANAASKQPRALPQDVAEEICDLYVLYNGRVCPLQTVAKDVTTKLYGKDSYKGLSYEQVFTGMMLFSTEWGGEEIIKLKGKAIPQILGAEGKYASWNDFFDPQAATELNALLERSRAGEDVPEIKSLNSAYEKYNIIAMLFGGELLKLFPYAGSDGKLSWYSQSDNLPAEMSSDEWLFVRKAVSYLTELAVKKDYDGLGETVGKIKIYQERQLGDACPSQLRFNAEQLYNSLNLTRVLAMMMSLVGILLFAWYISRMVAGKSVDQRLSFAAFILLAVLALYLLLYSVLRGYVSGHVPLSNGFETMQFMALLSIIGVLLLNRRFFLAMPFGYLLAGLCMMVSMMGEANPQITPLMPVLASPWMSIHVAVIMIAYVLLAFIAFNGLAAILINGRKGENTYAQLCSLHDISRTLLYPAVFLLTIGIFVGAVWANVSWGRYWGWDPKETWALITLLVYSLAFHSGSIKWFRKPIHFHIYCLAAFLCVLVTYFGVNFLLGGMHSYA